jgi:hypothetical protein
MSYACIDKKNKKIKKIIHCLIPVQGDEFKVMLKDPVSYAPPPYVSAASIQDLDHFSSLCTTLHTAPDVWVFF